MRIRFRVPLVRGVFRSRRLVVALAVLALVAGAGVSSASAASADPKTVEQCVGMTPPIADAHVALCLQLLSQAARPADYSPRDLQVAAPSSVISATSSETPERRVQEVSRWRPNPQAFIDAKNRLAQASGLTAEQLDSVGRWSPRLLRASSFVGVLSGDSLVSWVVRDGVLKPQLEGLIDVDQTLRDTYCVRYGNFATDWLTGFVVDGCPEWRATQDFNQLVGSRSVGDFVSYAGRTLFFAGNALANNRAQHYSSADSRSRMIILCSSGSTPPDADTYLTVRVTTNTGQTYETDRHHWWNGPTSNQANWCGPTPQTYSVNTNVDPYSYPVALQWVRKSNSGQTVEVRDAAEFVPDDAEWITRVRCLDGSNRYSVSEAFQQMSGAALSTPAGVQLDGCTPVGLDVGVQKKNSGTSSAGGGWSSVADPVRTGVSSADVPQPVRDWQTNFPNCWDGSCLLDLRKVIGGSMEMDCFDAPEQCVDWQTSVAADPATYRCYYAGSLVPISECNVYGKVFERDKVQQGTGYTDPATGQPVTTSTGTAVTTNPGAASTAMSSPASDPSSSRQCWPTGWGAFNPFEWVFQPVKCALEWAFVPRPTKLSQVQTKVQLAAVNSVPAQMVQGLNGWTAAVPSSSGCMGPLVQFDVAGLNYSAYPLQACDGALATAANFSRIALTIIAILTGIIAITRYVARIFGFSGVGEGGSA